MLHTTGEFPLCKYIVLQFNNTVKYGTFLCYIVIKIGSNVMGDVTIGFFLERPEIAGCRGVVVCIVILL